MSGDRVTDFAGGGPVLERIEEERLAKLKREQEAEDARIETGRQRKAQTLANVRPSRPFSRSLRRNRAAL